MGLGRWREGLYDRREEHGRRLVHGEGVGVLYYEIVLVRSVLHYCLHGTAVPRIPDYAGRRRLTYSECVCWQNGHGESVTSFSIS